MSNKQIHHIVADSIGDVRYCPSCGEKLEVMLDMGVDHDRECPECDRKYIQHEIEFLVETEEMQTREEVVEQSPTYEVLKNDTVEADEDIDVLRPNVDLRMERMSDRCVWLEGQNGGDENDIDYRYCFTVTDEGELRIDREIIRNKDD